MAHKVDLKLAERRISQGLHSKMLLEDAACARAGERRRGDGGGGGTAKNIESVCMLLSPNTANQFSFNGLISVWFFFFFFFKLTAAGL